MSTGVYVTGAAAPTGQHYYPAGNGTYNKPTGTGLTGSAAMPSQTYVPSMNGASRRLAGPAVGLVIAGGVAFVSVSV